MDGRARLRLVEVVLTAVLLATLATWNSLHKSLWTDEAYSLITSSGSLGYTFHRARTFELQPPLYFLLLNLWLRLSSAVPFARVLSTLAALASLLGLGAIARQLRLDRGLPPVLLVAVTPGVVWAAAEMRGYALTLALATGTIYFFLRLIADNPPHPWRDVACYTLFAYALLMTGYYGGFLLAGQWLGAVAVGRWRYPTIALSLVAIGLIPWVPTVLAQMGAHPDTSTRLTGLAEANHELTQLFLQAYLGHIPELALPHLGEMIALLFVIVGVVRWRDHGFAPDERALTIAALVPAAIIVLVRITGAAPIQPRYIVMTIPSWLTVAALWTARPASPAVRRFASVAIGLTLVGGLVAFEWNGAEIADWRGVGVKLAHERTDASQPVLVIPAQDALPLRHYYSGPGVVSGLAGEFDLQHYRPAAFVIRDTAQVISRLDSTGARSGVWIIVSRWENPPLDQIRLFERAMSSRYCPPAVTQLRGVRIYHAVAAPCPASSSP